MTKSAVHEITDNLDTGVMCARLGVKPRSIRKAREDRVFPARWWIVVNAMCLDRGIECPIEAFNWQLPEPTATAAE